MEKLFHTINLHAEIVAWDTENIFLRLETGAEIAWPYSRCTKAFQDSLQQGKRIELLLCDDTTLEEERTRVAKKMLNEILQTKI